MFTCEPAIGADATALFNYLTGYSATHQFSRLLVAPVNLRDRLRELIEREIEHQRAGRVGLLIFKMNGLDDPGMIRLLYQASLEGVQIHLLVRGICSLRPGIPGLSENIRVVSIVGRFLEHSRIYYFHNGGSEEIYLGSADLMPRNLNRRVEVLFPVSAPRVIARVRDEILKGCLADEVGARHMRPDGAYTPKSRTGRFESQSWLLAQRGSKVSPLERVAPEHNRVSGSHQLLLNTQPAAKHVPPTLRSLKTEIADLRQRLVSLRSERPSNGHHFQETRHQVNDLLDLRKRGLGGSREFSG